MCAPRQRCNSAAEGGGERSGFARYSKSSNTLTDRGKSVVTIVFVFLQAKNYHHSYGYTYARHCCALCGPRGSHGEREQGAAPAGDTLARYG